MYMVAWTALFTRIAHSSAADLETRIGCLPISPFTLDRFAAFTANIDDSHAPGLHIKTSGLDQNTEFVLSICGE